MIPPEQRLAAAIERYKTRPCPKCSGTRSWSYLFADKSRLTTSGEHPQKVRRVCLDCSAAYYRNHYTPEKGITKNHKYRSKVLAKRKLNPEFDKFEKARHNSALKSMATNLTDGYIRNFIKRTYNGKELLPSDIPQQLIETTRNFLKLNRQFNISGKQSKSTQPISSS